MPAMAQTTIPVTPDPRFIDVIEKSAAIEGQKLLAAISREYMKPSVARGFAGLAVSAALYAGAVIGIAVLDQWYLIVPLIFIAGLGGWGMHCIGHDCGHGSFSRSRRLNFLVGHVALLPLLYPFHAWRHVHNWHHTHTNSLELDNDWRPISEAVYGRMPLRHRILYVSMRTWAVWAGSINYWVQSIRPSTFPKKATRREVLRSAVWVVAVGGAYLATLTYLTGWQGLLLCFVAPWLAIHTWFSITTLMHHSSEDIPFLPAQYWTRNASKLLVTTDFMYPRWLLFLTHNISLHTAHHVSTAVPFYNLRKAQVALRQAYPDMVRVEKASVPKLWNILRNCRFYDPITGLYSTHRMQRADPAKAGPA